MNKFCPKCGLELHEDYNFCPACGYQLHKDVQSKNDALNLSDDNATIVVCENCGEENEASAVVCVSCGIKLKKEAAPPAARSYNTDKKNITQKKKKPFKGKSKKSKQSEPLKNEKEIKGLSNGQIIAIITTIIVAALLLLWGSGVFVTDKIETSVNAQNQIPSSGIDLSNITRINELEEKVKANPGNTGLILQLAHLKNDSGLYEQAIVNYKQYLAVNPKDADARIDMGVCYYNLRDFKNAISEMELALKYEPKHQIGYLNLGIVNLSAGNMGKAKEWWKKTVEIDPNTEYAKKAEELLKSY